MLALRCFSHITDRFTPALNAEDVTIQQDSEGTNPNLAGDGAGQNNDEENGDHADAAADGTATANGVEHSDAVPAEDHEHGDENTDNGTRYQNLDLMLVYRLCTMHSKAQGDNVPAAIISTKFIFITSMVRETFVFLVGIS